MAVEVGGMQPGRGGRRTLAERLEAVATGGSALGRLTATAALAVDARLHRWDDLPAAPAPGPAPTGRTATSAAPAPASAAPAPAAAPTPGAAPTLAAAPTPAGAHAPAATATAIARRTGGIRPEAGGPAAVAPAAGRRPRATAQVERPPTARCRRATAPTGGGTTGSVGRVMADDLTTHSSSAPRRPGPATPARAEFPDALVALTPAGVCDDDAWERWAADAGDADRQAELDADLSRPPTRAARLEEGLDRVARSLSQALPRPRPGRRAGRRAPHALPAGDAL